MARSGFNGFSDSTGRRIVILKDQKKRLVLVEGRPYMVWATGDVLAERMAVAQLSELEMGSQGEIAEAFRISGKSVYQYRRIFAAEGSAGLLGGKKGPKSHWKITREVRAHILYLFFIEGLTAYEQIKGRLGRWGKEVGITSIREVLLENGLIREVSVFDDLVNPVELFHTEEKDEQLRLDFDWPGEAGAGEAEEVELPPAAGEKKETDVFRQATTELIR